MTASQLPTATAGQREWHEQWETVCGYGTSPGLYYRCVRCGVVCAIGSFVLGKTLRLGPCPAALGEPAGGGEEA